MKEIGLITFHRTLNYGSLLQTFATLLCLKNNGANVELIDYRCSALEKREGLSFSKGFKNKLKSLLNWKKRKYFNGFLYKYFNVSKPVFRESIYSIKSMYKTIVVGSDIVWGRDITNHDYTYFLDFCSDDTRCISFASSVGNDAIYDDDELIGNLLTKFDRILVREYSAIDWVKRLSNKDAFLVCDPTMLLTPQDWLEHFKIKKKNNNYVLVYFNNDNGKCLSDAIHYAKHHHKKVIFINSMTPSLKYRPMTPKTLDSFLELFYNAFSVFTSSYHGVLFSLYFNKNLHFYKRAHSTRMNTISKLFDIQNLCFDEKSFLDDNDYCHEKINHKIDILRKESLKEILSIIKNERNM